MTALDKAMDRWANIKPDAFLSGSIVQARNTIEDMQKDIAALGRERAALTDALQDSLNMLRAAHMQCGVHHDGNKRVIKARALLERMK